MRLATSTRRAPPRAAAALAAILAGGASLLDAPVLAAQAAVSAAPLVVRVVDAGSGAPLRGAEVRLVREGADSTAAIAARTDADGVARLAGAPAGGTTVTVRALGFVPRSADAAAGPDTLQVRLTAAPLALDQLVVTAARREQRLTDAVVTTEVVSRREIEQTGATDLAAVLSEQAGIQLQRGHPSGAGIMLQGIGAERVLVLLDGQPLVGRISGNFDLARIPTAMIERVEVVKGPQSTLYGSEAMGGVVNIVTRSAPDLGWQGSVTALGGSEGRRDLLLGGSARAGAWSVVADGGLRQVEQAPGRAETVGALADRRDGSARVRWAPDTDTWAEASVLVLDERQQWQAGTLFDFADNRQLGARLTASRLFGGEHRLTPTLHLSRFDHLARQSRTAQPVANTGDEQVQQLAEAELLYAGRIAGLPVDAGVEARQEYIRSSDGRIRSDDGGMSRTMLSAEPFAQVELGGDRWSVVPGARLSWNEQWGSHLTPRVAARWRAADALTLRLSAGRGFRAPDFKELYMQFTNDNAGYAVYGNADLRPEHSDNLTLGAEWSAGALYGRAQLFHNRLRDFIETRPLPNEGALVRYAYANVDEGRTQGADLEAGLAVGALRLEAGYSYLSAIDLATDRALLGRPAHSGRASVTGLLPLDVRGSLTGVYTGATPMERAEDGTVTGERDAFFRTDLRLARRLPHGLELVAGADNLFDARPARWEGAVSRQLYAALAWSVAGGM